jgi:hypothetical protein
MVGHFPTTKRYIYLGLSICLVPLRFSPFIAILQFQKKLRRRIGRAMEGSKVIGDDPDLVYRGFISRGGCGEVHRVRILIEIQNI